MLWSALRAGTHHTSHDALLAPQGEDVVRKLPALCFHDSIHLDSYSNDTQLVSLSSHGKLAA